MKLEIVAPWRPQLWPRVGDELDLPTPSGRMVKVKILESIEGSHIVGAVKGVSALERNRWRGSPVTVVDRDSEILEPVGVWLWEECRA